MWQVDDITIKPLYSMWALHIYYLSSSFGWFRSSMKTMRCIGSNNILSHYFQGRTALWDSILLLCYRIKLGYGGLVRGMHLGSSALRILPVFESETETWGLAGHTAASFIIAFFTTEVGNGPVDQSKEHLIDASPMQPMVGQPKWCWYAILFAILCHGPNKQRSLSAMLLSQAINDWQGWSGFLLIIGNVELSRQHLLT